MKKLKKVLCLVIAIAAALSMSVVASAESDTNLEFSQTGTNVESDSQEAEFALVSEELIEGDGWTADVETYVEDGVSVLANNLGTKRYKCTATFYDSDTHVKCVTIWVVGTFSWNQDKNQATVTDYDSDHTVESAAFKETDSNLKTGNNKGGFLGNRYAFVQKDVVLTNGGGRDSFTLWLDVNVKGETNVKAQNAKNPYLEEVK